MGQRRRAKSEGSEAADPHPRGRPVVVDVIEEPVPGVTVVTEFEATEVGPRRVLALSSRRKVVRRPRNQKNHKKLRRQPAVADEPL